MKKVSKTSVNYRDGKPTKHCGNCAMFHARTKTCDLVNGVINSGDVCDKWVSRGSK